MIYEPGQRITKNFTARNPSGQPTDADDLVLTIYRDESAGQSNLGSFDFLAIPVQTVAGVTAEREGTGWYHVTIKPEENSALLIEGNYLLIVTGGSISGTSVVDEVLMEFVVKDSTGEIAAATAAALAGRTNVNVYNPLGVDGAVRILKNSSYTAATGQQLSFPLRATDPDASTGGCKLRILNADGSTLIDIAGTVSGTTGDQDATVSVTTTSAANLTLGALYRYRVFAVYGTELSAIAKGTITRED